jgi:hypothetical protein
MYSSLSGSEPALVALWNFEDRSNPGRNACPRGRHGALVGGASLLEATLPVPGELIGPGVIEGTVFDSAGRPAPAARVSASQNDRELAETATSAQGHYRLVVGDVRVPTTLLARFGRQAACVWDKVFECGQQQLDLRLTEAASLKGEVKALDNATALSGVVVQVLKPGGLPNAQPPLWEPDEHVVAGTATDASGHFEFDLLKPGLYEVRLLKPGGAIYCTNRVEVGDRQLAAPTPSLQFRIAPFKKGGWKTYRVTDGLAGDSVTSVRLGAKNRLWIGTWTGASEYDGNRFRNYVQSSGLVQSLVNDLCPLADGRVWFAHQFGLSLLDSDNFSEICPGPQGTVERNYFQSLFPDTNGVLWASAFYGVWLA